MNENKLREEWQKYVGDAHALLVDEENANRIPDWWLNKFSTYKEELIKKIEEREVNVSNVDEVIGDVDIVGREKDAFAMGYNQALDDIINLIKE